MLIAGRSSGETFHVLSVGLDAAVTARIVLIPTVRVRVFLLEYQLLAYERLSGGFVLAVSSWRSLSSDGQRNRMVLPLCGDESTTAVASAQHGQATKHRSTYRGSFSLATSA